MLDAELFQEARFFDLQLGKTPLLIEHRGVVAHRGGRDEGRVVLPDLVLHLCKLGPGAPEVRLGLDGQGLHLCGLPDLFFNLGLQVGDAGPFFEPPHRPLGLVEIKLGDGELLFHESPGRCRYLLVEPPALLDVEFRGCVGQVPGKLRVVPLGLD